MELRPVLQGCGRTLRCCYTQKRIWSIPFSPTVSTTCVTNREGSGTAGLPKPSSAAPYYAYSVTAPAARRIRCTVSTRTRSFSTPTRSRSFFPRLRPRGGFAPGSNAGKAPLGCSSVRREVRLGQGPAARHQSDAIIYELHVGGSRRTRTRE